MSKPIEKPMPTMIANLQQLYRELEELLQHAKPETTPSSTKRGIAVNGR